MSLQEVMEQTTHRQYMAWMEFFLQEWRRPDKSDYYLAQIAMEVRRVLSTKPEKIKLKHFMLKMDDEETKKRSKAKTKTARKTQAELSKSVWFGRTQFRKKGQHKKREKNEVS